MVQLVHLLFIVCDMLDLGFRLAQLVIELEMAVSQVNDDPGAGSLVLTHP